MERRLEQRLEHLPHGLPDHPVDHVGHPQPALPASRLGDVGPADLPGPVPPLEQDGPQLGQHDRPPLKQRLDRLSIRTGAPLFDATFSNALVNRYATSSIVAGAAVSALTIAFGAPARSSPSRSRGDLPPGRPRVLLRVAPCGFSAVAIGRRSCNARSSTGTAFPCPPVLDPARSAGITPPSGRMRSSDFCWAIGLRPSVLRPTEPRDPADLPG